MAELNKTSLEHALRSAKTDAEVQKVIRGLAAFTGSAKEAVLAKAIGKDNLTYFMLTTKTEALKGLELRVKGTRGQQDITLLTKLVKDWCFVTMSDVKRLATGAKTGSFFIDNECLRGSIVFEMDKNGAITKMVIPRLGSKSMKGGKVVFEKK